MKNCFEVVDDVYKALKEELSPVFSGEILKHRKPSAITGECVVIKCTDVDNEQLQKAKVEIHLYVPAVEASIGGIEERLPNQVRFLEVSDLILLTLTHVSGDDYHFDVSSAGHLQEDNDHFYLNISLDYYHENL